MKFILKFMLAASIGMWLGSVTNPYPKPHPVYPFSIAQSHPPQFHAF